MLVLPSLVVNYFGQGALLRLNGDAARQPFFLLAPAWARFPLVGIATAAAIIASQALIWILRSDCPGSCRRYCRLRREACLQCNRCGSQQQ